MMPSYLQESFFLEAPYLLASTDKQYLINPGPAGKLLLQEGIGSAWGEPRPLPLHQDNYCAVLDKNRLPHLVSMEQGHFYHLVPTMEPEEETPVLFYREESKQCSHFLMAGDQQGALHFICLAIDLPAERWWLLHHRYTGSSWEEPRVIDFGSGASENYGDLALDAHDCLHLAYRIDGDSQASLYYRYFDPGAAHWSKAVPLSTSTAIAYPSLVVDQNQNLHLLWRTVFEEKYYICYRFKGGPGWKTGGWKPETVISTEMTGPPFPFFSYQSGELLIAWLESDTLFRYRFAGDHWDQIAPQRFEKPQLIRSNSFSLEGRPLNYWIAVESSESAAGGLPSAILPAVDYNDLESDFTRLDRYSGKLIGQISDLSTAKERLQEELRSRSKEMLLFSQQSEKKMCRLQKSLEHKDAELQKLQEDFTQVVDTLKQKIEQGRQTREAERKRYLSTLQELKKERHQFENILQEKEKTIAQLESRNREQLYQIEQLREENEALKSKTRASSWSVKKLWERIIYYKKP